MQLARVLAFALVGIASLYFSNSVPGAHAAQPPQYAVRSLDGAPGESVRAVSMNAKHWTTGGTGPGQFSSSLRAFVAPPGGPVTLIDTSLYSSSMGYAINNVGQVAGIGQRGSAVELFRYAPGVGLEVRVTLPGTIGSVFDMNDAGDIIVGWASGSGGIVHFMLYTNEHGLQDFATMPGAPLSPADINNARQIVGARGTYPNYQAFILQDGDWDELGTLGGQSSSAYYAADDGTVIGGAQIADGTSHAFRYTVAGGMEDLQTLPDAVSSGARLISSSGVIAGNFVNTHQKSRPFYYRDGEGMVDMGFDLAANWGGVKRINASAEMVGERMDAVYEFHQFYYRPDTGMHELQSLLADPLDWVSIDDFPAMDDAGRILVTGWTGLRTGTALLIPIRAGDLSGDGAVDFGDINPFVQALLDPTGYVSQHPVNDIRSGDVNGDGYVDFGDINPFVGLLIGD